MLLFIVLYQFLLLVAVNEVSCAENDEMDTVEPPTACETCVLMAQELKSIFIRTHERTESTFIENTDSFCDRMLAFRLDKSREGLSRFTRGETDLMKTLKGLRGKGVKVELGYPDTMWDKPSVEVIQLKSSCEQNWELWEDEILEWFLNGANVDIMDFLCRHRVLNSDDQVCLQQFETRDEL